MASMDVAAMAAETNTSAEEILKHCKALGIHKSSPTDAVSARERLRILAHLRRPPATPDKKKTEPKAVVVSRKIETMNKALRIVRPVASQPVKSPVKPPVKSPVKSPVKQIEVRKLRTFRQPQKAEPAIETPPATGKTAWNPADKPETVADYLKWAEVVLGSSFNADDRLRSMYDTNSQNILNRVNQHAFFAHFSQKTEAWNVEYEKKTGSRLFTSNGDPKLNTKSYESVVEKTFRQNILLNGEFPQAPTTTGWLDYNSIYEHFNDLVRGSLVCRFIDGPAYVANAIVAYAEECGLKSRQYSHERDDGYYAYHVYIKFPVSIFDLSFGKTEKLVEVEIQLTTQLQEVLRSLTHHHYETERLMPNPDRGKWKWEFESSRFKVGYLSHTLHLLESVILEARNNVLGDGKEDKGDK
jgi:ppGpp synthetase/RelA/SpoT-type nucleotidyltranferase